MDAELASLEQKLEQLISQHAAARARLLSQYTAAQAENQRLQERVDALESANRELNDKLGLTNRAAKGTIYRQIQEEILDSREQRGRTVLHVGECGWRGLCRQIQPEEAGCKQRAGKKGKAFHSFSGSLSRSCTVQVAWPGVRSMKLAIAALCPQKLLISMCAMFSA